MLYLYIYFIRSVEQQNVQQNANCHNRRKTLEKKEERRIQSFDNKCIRRLVGIPWTLYNEIL